MIIGGIVEVDVMEVDPSSMAEYLEELEREDRRRHRIEQCGQYNSRPNPSDGRFRTVVFNCGYWRECDKCFSRRVAEFEERYEAIQTTTPVIGVTEAGSEGEAKKMVRHLRHIKRQYWRIPVEGGGAVILYDATDGEVYPQAETVLDWHVLAKTPEGTRYSGNLGKDPPEVDDFSEKKIINVPQVMVRLPDGVSLEECYQEAMERTADLDPEFDEYDLSFACWVRTTTLKEVILELGGEILNESVAFIAVTDKSYKRWRDRDNPTRDAPRVDARTAIEELFEL